ncbi:hypothetical protein DXX94_15560 [Thalassotalea euphylliae]|uniref:Uncharacterized protein n=1 Tax=Thalassotalea euphylliae TaxID=1655234 RepID=A0A3E0U5Z8_9GAMM|nr:hypothetical protein DXX94_15560 [Thalassotalea euphylliae]
MKIVILLARGAITAFLELWDIEYVCKPVCLSYYLDVIREQLVSKLSLIWLEHWLEHVQIHKSFETKQTFRGLLRSKEFVEKLTKTSMF